jgi:hypothetical protein
VVAKKAVTVTIKGGDHVQSIFAETPSSPFGYASPSAGCGPAGPGTCTFQATFAPTDALSRNDTLDVEVCSPDNSVCSTLTVDVSGTGRVPATLSASSLSFTTPVGTPVRKTIKVTLDNGYTVSDVTIAQPDPGFSTDAAQTCVGKPTTCTFGITYDPLTVGSVTTRTYVTVCATGGTACVTLKAVSTTGLAQDPATVSTTLLQFGSEAVNFTKTKTFTITPHAGWEIVGVDPHQTTPPFGATLSASCASGGVCTVTGSFSPTQPIAYTGSITVEACNFTQGICTDLNPVSATGTGTQLASTTSVIAPVNVYQGQTVSLSAKVTANVNGTIEPVDGGTVKFLDGTTVICAAASISPSGVATCSWLVPNNAPLGKHTIKAVYSGDAAYKTSSGLRQPNVLQAPS